MGLLHPGAGKKLVIARYWTRNRARPSAVSQASPQRPEAGYVEQPGVRIELCRYQRGKGRHHAAHDARRDLMVQRRKQQTAAASAGETECTQARGIDPSSAASTSNATRSSVSTAPANV